MRNKYRLLAVGMTAVMLMGTLCACGKEKKEEDIVQISVWTDERNETNMKEALAQFQEQYKDEVTFEFSVSIEGEDTCKETVLANPERAADLFTFADDQLDELCRHEALLEITEDAESVISAVGGKDSGAAEAAMRGDKLYAYPVTSGNGYFLYYNKAYFSESDISSMDQILEVCARNNKKFTMNYTSGWYLYSFFKGAGLTLSYNEEGTANICNWNATDTEYKGVDVADSILTIAKNDAFESLDDDGFLAGVESGEIIAGINGPWNAQKVAAQWGDNYAAAKLPTYTLCGEQKQMYSFAGYKIMGINAHTKYPDWCMKLANYLTDKENQLKRFEVTGECPANVEAAAEESVQKSVAVAALAAQSPYAGVQRIAEPYWTASSKLGVTLAAGNPDRRDLQELLDEIQQLITATE